MLGAAGEPEDALDRFTTVSLLVEQNDGGVRFPVGARGVIVDAYDDGTYGVEFSSPVEDVIIVKRSDLEPAEDPGDN